MSEYIFVHLIDKQVVGADLGGAIPQHLTLLHWFEHDGGPASIIGSAESFLNALDTIETISTIEDMFGPDKDVPVMRIERTEPLLNLHLGLVAVMKELGVTFDSRWTGKENWNPHVTDKKDKKLAPDVPVTISDVDLITRDNLSGKRTILHRFDLGQV